MELLDKALRLHSLGANITAIAETKANGEPNKGPIYKWKDRPPYPERQSEQMVRDLPWDGYRNKKTNETVPAADRVGVIHGPDGCGGWRVLDIDAIKLPDGSKAPVERSVVDAVLAAMGLPLDYAWARHSGGGAGWHIWLICHEELPPDTFTPKPKESGVYIGDSLDADAFDHLEVRWEGVQTVFAGDVPDEPPLTVTIDQLRRGFYAVAKPHAKPEQFTLPTPTPPPVAKAGDDDTIRRIKDRLDIVQVGGALFGPDTQQDGDRVRILGNSGLLIDPRGGWIQYGTNLKGDVFDLFGLHRYGDAWDRHDKEQFKAILDDAARMAGIVIEKTSSRPPLPASLRAHLDRQKNAQPENGSQSENTVAAFLARFEGLHNDDLITALQASLAEPINFTPVELEQVRAALTQQGMTSRMFTAWNKERARIWREYAAHQRRDQSRPTIDVTEMDVRAICAQIWDMIVAANNQNAYPLLYRQGSGKIWARLRDNARDTENRPVYIDWMDKDGTRYILNELIQFQKTYDTDRGSITRIVACPGEIVDHIQANIDPRIPLLTHIVHTPFFSPGGALVDSAGYHAESRTLLLPAPSLNVGPIPERPTDGDLEWARSLILDDLLVDFPFEDQASRANAVALLLLPFARRMIRGLTPMHLIESARQGTGKGLLQQLISLVTQGVNPTLTSAPEHPDEWRKTITAALLGAPLFVFFDNVHELRSRHLEQALTADTWGDRILGVSEHAEIDNRAVWVASGNNISYSVDMSRRASKIRIVALEEQPWRSLRTFKHKNIRRWAIENRSNLVRACLILIRAGLQRATPAQDDAAKRGSYEEWYETMGRILAGIGIPDFDGNAAQTVEDAEMEGGDSMDGWRDLCAHWWDAHGAQPVKAGDLMSLINSHQIDLNLRGATEHEQKISLGMLLIKRRGQVYNVVYNDGSRRDFRIATAGKVRTTRLWKLVASELITPTPPLPVTTPPIPLPEPEPEPEPDHTPAPTDRAHNNGHHEPDSAYAAELAPGVWYSIPETERADALSAGLDVIAHPDNRDYLVRRLYDIDTLPSKTAPPEWEWIRFGHNREWQLKGPGNRTTTIKPDRQSALVEAWNMETTWKRLTEKARQRE